MTDLRDDYSRFRSEGIELAGALGDFQQRAGAYYELYRHSEGNFVFPLIAAHGALWGAGHMRRGLKISHYATCFCGFGPQKATHRIGMVEAFTDTLKDINRQVLVMTYLAYQLTRRHADNPELRAYIPESLIAPLATCHTARRNGETLNDDEKRALFEAAFHWEQDNVVGPRIEEAIPQFDWPFIRALSLRPPIGFAYFGRLQWLWFRDFSSRDERIRRGLRAFEIAMKVGLGRVEDALFTYDAPSRRRMTCLTCVEAR